MSESFQIVEYTTTAAALAELRARHGGPFDVSTSKGLALAKEARAEVRGYRVALETLRKEIKAPALERCRLIDEEAKRITAALLAIEEPIDAAIKAEEKRKEDEKAAKARAEAARVAAIAARISGIRNRVSAVAGQSAAAIRAALEQTHALQLISADFDEFLPDAVQALDDTVAALATLLLERVAFEDEQARLQAEREAEETRLREEREELARLRAEEAARQAERARLAAEARQAEEARLREERERQEAELRARREAQERADREARQARAAEEARAAQRAELEARQRRLEEAEQRRQAVKSRKVKASVPADPLADLKRALSAGEIQTPQALEQAYQIGFEAGLKAAQSAA